MQTVRVGALRIATKLAGAAALVSTAVFLLVDWTVWPVAAISAGCWWFGRANNSAHT
jgi:hypothetical protein